MTRGGSSVLLPAKEFETLKFMIRNAERVISRDDLLSAVWGYRDYPKTRTVDNHILTATKTGDGPSTSGSFSNHSTYGLQVCAVAIGNLFLHQCAASVGAM